MSTKFTQSQILDLALRGLDAQIAGLVTQREQLAAMIENPTPVAATLPPEITHAQPVAVIMKQAGMSAAARAKISASKKQWWAAKKAAKKAKGKVSK